MQTKPGQSPQVLTPVGTFHFILKALEDQSGLPSRMLKTGDLRSQKSGQDEWPTKVGQAQVPSATALRSSKRTA